MGEQRDRRLHIREDRRRGTLPGRWALAAVLFLAPGLGLTGCGDHGGSSATTPPGAGAAVRAELLFVVQATGAIITTSEAGGLPILHLTGVAPSLLAFADRPLRIAAARPTATLAARWAEYGFAADPPNGALSVGGGRLEEPLALELREPRYDATAATLEFAVTSLLPDPAAVLRALLTSDTGCSVALFIDATQPVASSAPPMTEDVASLIDTLGSMTGRTFTAEQQQLISDALGSLLQVEAGDSSRDDPQLIANNVGLFIDDLQQVLAVSFTSEQRQLLTRTLVRMIGAAA